MALRLRRGTDSERLGITPLAGELIYTTDTKKVYVGDGLTVGGTAIDSNAGIGIDSLSDVDTTTLAPTIGWVLKWNGTNWIPAEEAAITGAVVEGANYRINVIGDDSTVMVNSATNTFTGSLQGTVEGELVGSVFSDDSSVIIDGIDDSLTVSTIKTRTNQLVVNSSVTGRTDVRLEAYDGNTVLKFVKNTDTDLSSDTTNPYGGIYFERDDISGPLTTSLILGGTDFITLGNDPSGNFTSPFLVTIRNGSLGVGITEPAEKLDVVGNVNVSGTLIAADTNITGTMVAASGNVTGTMVAGSLQGTLTLDDSTVVIDGINGSIVAPSYVQFGSFTTAERDALTAGNGMVVYNTTTNKFNGYQNSGWINIDDGTAA